MMSVKLLKLHENAVFWLCDIQDALLASSLCKEK